MIFYNDTKKTLENLKNNLELWVFADPEIKKGYNYVITKTSIALENFRYQPTDIKLVQDQCGIVLIYKDMAKFYINIDKFIYISLIDNSLIISNWIDFGLIKSIILNFMSG